MNTIKLASVVQAVQEEMQEHQNDIPPKQQPHEKRETSISVDPPAEYKLQLRQQVHTPTEDSMCEPAFPVLCNALLKGVFLS